MTPAQVLDRARALGCELVLVQDDQLKLTGPKDARAQVAKLVRAHKAEVLALLRADREAIAATVGATCDDCQKPAMVLVCTDYGARFCRGCLRPEPLGSTPTNERNRSMTTTALVSDTVSGAVTAAVPSVSTNHAQPAGATASLGTTKDTRDACDICGSATWSAGHFAIGKVWCAECWAGRKPAASMVPTTYQQTQIAAWLRPQRPHTKEQPCSSRR
jgi:hypothetical protein